MGPKKKPPTEKVEEEVVGSQFKIWEQGLKAALINEDSWSCIVAFLVESLEEHVSVTNYFIDSVNIELRRSVKCISLNGMLQYVEEFAKGKKPANPPAFYEVCSEIESLLSAGMKPSAELLACYIKFRILCLKRKDIEIAEMVKAQKEADEAVSKVESPSKAAKGKGKKDAKDDKSKKGSPTQGSHEAKKNTKLRRRGEEWKDKKFVDDAPVGTQLYILITGFYDPSLLAALIDVGIPLTCLIQMQREGEGIEPKPIPSVPFILDTEKQRKETVLPVKMEAVSEVKPEQEGASTEKSDEKAKPEGKGSKTGGKGAKEEKGGKNEGKAPKAEESMVKTNEKATPSDIQTAEDHQRTPFPGCPKAAIHDFWTQWPTVFHQTMDVLKDVMYILYRPPVIPLDVEIKEPELSTVRRKLNDDLAYLFYDLQDVKRQHKNYLRNMYVLPIGYPPGPVDLDAMVEYSKLNNEIPAECSSVPFLVHALLTQVEKLVGEWEKVVEEPEHSHVVESVPVLLKTKTRPSTLPKTNSTSSELQVTENKWSAVSEQFDKLNFKYGINEIYIPPPELEQTRFLVYGDEVKLDTFHLKDCNVDITEAVFKILKLTPACLLWNYFTLATEEEQLLNSFHIHELQQSMGNPHISREVLEIILGLTLFEFVELEYFDTFAGEVYLKASSIPTILQIRSINRSRESDFHERSLQVSSVPTVVRLKSALRETTTDFNVSESSSQTVIRQTSIFCTKRAFGGYRSVSLQSILSEASFDRRAYSSESSSMEDSSCESAHEVQTMSLMSLASETSVDSACEKLRKCVELLDLLYFARSLIEPKSGYLGVIYMEDYSYVEDLDPEVLVQSLNEAFNTFNSVDFTYFSPLDIILLTFYNFCNKENLYCEEWLCSLTNPIGMRDFFDYIVDQEKEWLEEEEEKYQRMMRFEEQKQFLRPSDLKGHIPVLSYEGITDMDFLLKTSLKYKKHVEELKKLEEEEQKTQESVKPPSVKDKKQKGKEEGEKEGKAKGGKQDKGGKTKGKGNVDVEPKEETKTPEKEAVATTQIREQKRLGQEWRNFKFFGYDLGPNRVQVSGNLTEFYSDDGTSCRVQLTEYLYKETVVSINVTNLNNTLYFHSFVDAHGKGYINELMFHILFRNNILAVFAIPGSKLKMLRERNAMSVKARNYYSRLSTVADIKVQPRGRNNQFMSEETNAEEMPERGHQNQGSASVFDLRVTWPSGLILETVRDSVFYIKQHYISKGPHCADIKNEVNRCFLPDGSVLIFKSHGNVDVLCHDGTIFYCRKFGRRSLKGAVPEEEADEKGRKDSGKKKSDKKPDVKKEDDKKKKMVKKGSDKGELGDKPKEQDQLEVSEYLKIFPDGQQHTFSDGSVTKHRPFFLRTATDVLIGDVLKRRGDNTNLLLKGDGSLVVTFADKTRITSTFVVVENDNLSYEDDIGSEITFEDYVSVYSIHTLEHPNYAAVTFDGRMEEVKLSMPDDTSITVTPSGEYRVQADEGATLHISEKNVTFLAYPCKECNSVSRTVLDFTAFISSAHQGSLCTIVDTLSNIFTVNYDGTCDLQKSTTDEDDEASPEILQEPLWDHINCHPSAFCIHQNPSLTKRYFVLKRNLKGMEFLHDNYVREFLYSIKHKAESAVHERDDPSNEMFTLRTVFQPVTKTCSEKWLMNYQHSETPLGRKAGTKEETKKSFSWLSPFPKSIPPKEWPIEVLLPNILLVRCFQQIIDLKREFLISLYQGFDRYIRMSRKLLYTDFQIYLLEHKEEETVSENVKKKIETGDIKFLIDWYKYSRQPPKPAERQRRPSHDARLAVWRTQFLKEKDEEYRNKLALRTHYIPPYFHSEMGKVALEKIYIAAE